MEQASLQKKKLDLQNAFIIALRANWVNDPTIIKHIFVNYFEFHFCGPAIMSREVIRNCPRDLDIPHISQDDILCLNQPLMTKEVKDGVFQIVALKASGIDGKTGLFYEIFWVTILFPSLGCLAQ
ncbi:hypothetical protein PVK06_010803 [Gossypium arboreum]|uniref:Uncharacterized protein n=1 Tax=Gossypium arboreum TaxID=29729 RepID=A0ABR0Q7U2_GOSAR|nr:hypothetical protein PVK06_010803 [Gossypium arboreum]